MKLKHLWLPILPYILFAVGFGSNALVCAFNGGQMPVQEPGACHLDPSDDPLHVCMDHNTHMKMLADWILIPNVGVASPGDLLEWAFAYTKTELLWLWLGLTLSGFEFRLKQS